MKININIIIVLSVILITFSCVDEHVVDPPDDNNNETGIIKLSSEPDGAEIFLQGETTNKFTPDSITGLESGVYEVTLKYEDYYDTTFEASVFKNLPYFKNVVMRKIIYRGSVFFNSEPQGASIIFNNENEDKVTPDSVSNIPVGNYSASLSLDGYYDTTFSVNILANQTITKNITLEKIDSTGNLFIESDPSGASIYLGDSLTGKSTPDSLLSLKEGNYEVTLKLQGYEDTTFTAEVLRQQTNSLYIEMKETTSGGKIVIDSEPQGAEIFLEDTFTEKVTPDSLTDLESGVYSVTLKLEGYKDTTTTVLLLQNSREYKFITLTDTLPPVDVEIDYRTNQFDQLIFSFTFNQDILLNRIEIKKPTETEFQTSNFNNSLIRKGVKVDFSFPEKIPGIWQINFYGRKAVGEQEEFELNKQILVL